MKRAYDLAVIPYFCLKFPLVLSSNRSRCRDIALEMLYARSIVMAGGSLIVMIDPRPLKPGQQQARQALSEVNDITDLLKRYGLFTMTNKLSGMHLRELLLRIETNVLSLILSGYVFAPMVYPRTIRQPPVSMKYFSLRADILKI